MNIWVCEFISAGGLAAEALPASLLQEGLLMRDALLADLQALGHDCITSHDARVPAPQHATSVAISSGQDPWQVWRSQCQSSNVEAVWVIAPETDGVLLALQAMAQTMGKPWIGCTQEAIAVTTHKSAMANHLAAHEVTAKTVKIIPHQFLRDWPKDIFQATAWVVKPDDGAGCEHTYYFDHPQQLIDLKNYFYQHHQQLLDKMLVQPYVAGQALSMSVIASQSGVKVIGAHTQHIAVTDANIHYDGAGVHHAAQHLPAMQQLAEQMHQAIPGLIGYWGADVILDAQGQFVLVEVNPRLTTPYTGLAAVLPYSPAAAILKAVLTQQYPTTVAQYDKNLHLAKVLHD